MSAVTGWGLRPAVRRPVSKDTPDRTDAPDRNCPASEGRPKRTNRTLQTLRTVGRRDVGTEALAQRYSAGHTLRQIGAEIGHSHATVLNRLRSLKRYPALVTKVLRMRTERAFYALTIARTRTKENERRAKLAAFILARERPARFRQWLRRGLSRLSGVGEIRRIGVEYRARADCQECGDRRMVEVRGAPGAWSWQCVSCGAGHGEAARPKPGRRR